MPLEGYHDFSYLLNPTAIEFEVIKVPYLRFIEQLRQAIILFMVSTQAQTPLDITMEFTAHDMTETRALHRVLNDMDRWYGVRVLEAKHGQDWAHYRLQVYRRDEYVAMACVAVPSSPNGVSVVATPLSSAGATHP